jgi:hypothetical protein
MSVTCDISHSEMVPYTCTTAEGSCSYCKTAACIDSFVCGFGRNVFVRRSKSIGTLYCLDVLDNLSEISCFMFLCMNDCFFGNYFLVEQCACIVVCLYDQSLRDFLE